MEKTIQNHYGTGDNVKEKHEHYHHVAPHIVPKVLTKQVGLANDIDFVGRKEELEKVEELLNKDTMLILNGIGGIGKSTLASYYLNQKKDEFDYYGFVQVNEDIKLSLASACNTSLDLKSEKIDDLFAEIMNKLQNLEGKKLLIIDDVKEMNNQLEEMNALMTLKNSGFQILFTSRETKEILPQHTLNIMNPKDARELFLKYYPTDEIDKVDKILKDYLDNHTLFIEITAKTLKQRKRTLSLDKMIEKFVNGEFSVIKKNKRESFNLFLNNLFQNDKILQDEEILLFLKRLAVLPSIEISFDDLYKFLVCEDEERLEEFLIELVDNGWLIEFEHTYKFHQILKEFVLTNHTPKFESIKNIFMYLFKLSENSADLQVAIFNKDILVFFESLYRVIKDYQNLHIIVYTMNLGSMYRNLAIYNKALRLGKLSVEKVDTFLQNNNVEEEELKDIFIWKSTIYNNLSQTYYSLGQYKEVLVLDKEVLNIRREILGKSHIATIQSYHNLAQLYFSLGDVKESGKLFEETIYLLNKLDKKYTDNAFMYIHEKATLYSNYASFLIKMSSNNKIKALKYAQEAVDIYEEEYGENNATIGTFYFNLAHIYEHFKEYEQAEELYIKVLKLKQEICGENHDDVAATYLGLALFYINYNNAKCKVSLEYLYKALKIYKIIYQSDMNPRTAMCYDNLGSIYNKCGDYRQANIFTLKALKLHEKLLGKSHYTTVQNYSNVGVSYYLLKDFKKAKYYMLKAITYKKSLLKDDTVKEILNYGR